MRERLKLARERAIRLLELEAVERLLDERLELAQLLGVERLLDEVERAAVGDGVHRGANRSLPRDDDALGGHVALPDFAEQRDPIDLRHLEIGEHDAERLGDETLEGALAVARRSRCRSLRREEWRSTLR